MAEVISMPRLGQSVETCIITRWFKEKGDFVEEGELLFAYETDKAAFEESAPISGIVLEIFYKEGDEVPVLANVAVIGKEGESVIEFMPVGKTITEKSREISKDERYVQESTESAIVNPQDDLYQKKVKISPRAKNIARDKGIDIHTLKGTGPNGRILARDVESRVNAGTKSPVIPPVSFSESTDIDYSIVTISNLRKIIANSMHTSLRDSAQLTHHLGADARKILNLRQEVKQENEARRMPNITLNDMVCFAVIRALIKIPVINSHLIADKMKIFRKVHLGIAVDTERGLMVPVLRNAEEYSLRGLSSQIKALSDKCKKGNIEPDLLKSEAATFTVSNLGSYGIEFFTPVINLPQTGILGVNTISYRPADLGNGVIGFVPYIGLSLTYDHRALDGAPASSFLREVKNQIETFNASLH